MRNATRQRNRKNNQVPPVEIKDKSGVTFDPVRHIAVDAFTKAGLFKLKPGQRR